MSIAHNHHLLNEREMEALYLIAEGASNATLAERLGMTRGSTEQYVSRVLGKLDASNRTQAIANAYHLGVLVPRRPQAA